MNNTPAIPTRRHLEAFFARAGAARGRLIFAFDATASRQETWDQAAHLTGEMFKTVAAVGALDVQLVYFQGHEKCVASSWVSDAKRLTDIMTKVQCESGYTQIRKVLRHVRKEHAREKINAVVFVGDCCEETAHDLYNEAGELGNVAIFLFQEGHDKHAAEIFTEIARITGGAIAQFDANAAQRLADLLKAVAAFAVGGIRALADQKTEAAKLLLTQIKK
jgi:hypothetical protein